MKLTIERNRMPLALNRLLIFQNTLKTLVLALTLVSTTVLA
ncbi:MAG: hypothetical protein ACJA2E_002684, partial [Arenicella sp.]